MSCFETETLTQEDKLKGLAMAHTPHRRVILDMDSSESPVHGQQEGAAYNGPRFIGVSAIILSFYSTSSGIAKERR